MFQIPGLLFWLVVIPYCIGMVPAALLAEERRDPGFLMLAGYFTMWALYGTVTIPVVLFVKYDNFIIASDCFMVLSILCAAGGRGTYVPPQEEFRDRPRKDCFCGLYASDAVGRETRVDVISYLAGLSAV